MHFGEDEVQSITESVWASVLGLEVRRCPEWVAGADDAPMAGYVRISGAWQGAVVLCCPVPLARETARIMFGTEADATSSAQTADALGELANMTGGNLKSLLPEPCELSLPTVVSGAGGEAAAGAELLARVGFECLGRPFVVSVFERRDGAGA